MPEFGIARDTTGSAGIAASQSGGYGIAHGDGGYGIAGGGSSAPEDNTGVAKLKGFALSTLESFPEMFGIRPSEQTEAFRAANPVSGGLSEALGFAVPFLGEAKGLSLIPKLGEVAPRVGELVGERLAGKAIAPFASAGAQAATEAGIIGAANVGFAATPIPGAAYEALTGDPKGRQTSLADLALQQVPNVALAGGLGGLLGGWAANAAKGAKIGEIVPEAAPDQPTLQGVRALDDTLSRVADPTDGLDLSDTTVGRLARESEARKRLSLADSVPDYSVSTTEEAQHSGTFGSEVGNLYKPLVGDKNGVTTRWLNYRAKWKNASGGDRIMDENGVLGPDAQTALDSLGTTWQDLATNAQDVRTISAKTEPEMHLRIADQDGIKLIGDGSPTVYGSVRPEDLPSAESTAAWKNAQQIQTRLTTGPFSYQGDGIWAAQEGNGFWTVAKKIQGNDALPNVGELYAGAESKLTDAQAAFDAVKAKQADLAKARKAAVQLGDGDAQASLEEQIAWAQSERDSAAADLKAAKGTLRQAPRVLGRGDVTAPAPGDKWVVLRTDRPEVFAPSAAATADEISRSAYFPMSDGPLVANEPIFDAVGRFVKMTGNDLTKLAGPATESGARSAARNSLDAAANIVTPTNPLATRNPLLNRAQQALKDAQAVTQSNINKILYGETEFGTGSLASRLARGAPAKTGTNGVAVRGNAGLAALVKGLTPADLAQIKAVAVAEAPIEQVRMLHQQGVVTTPAMEMLEHLQGLSDSYGQRIRSVQDVVRSQEGTSLVEAWRERAGHYGLSRDFSGPYKVLVKDGDGNLHAIVPGATAEEAKANAAKLIADAGQPKYGNSPWYDSGMLDQTQYSPAEFAKLMSAVKKPGFTNSRGDLLGHTMSIGDLTQEKLLGMISDNVRARENYLRDIAVWEHIAPLHDDLARTFPKDAEVLRSSLERSGVRANLDPGSHPEGAFAAWQNWVVDKALHVAGLSGNNSATKIVNNIKAISNQFQFNFGNMLHIAHIMVGTFQTLLPESSYILHAPPEALARDYATAPIMQGGKLAGSLNFLSEIRIFLHAMSDMFTGTPHPELVDLTKRLMQEGTISHFSETHFGSDGALLHSWQDQVRDPHNFIQTVKNANEFLTSHAEEFSRGLSVSTAFRLGKLAGLSGDRLHVFAREMIGKVNFNYGVADRAKIFTTPLGSALGTFKNWIFHYMANMVRYAAPLTRGEFHTLPALMWQTAATGLFAGAVGSPFVMPIGNAFSKFVSNKDLMQNAFEAAGGDPTAEKVLDSIMYGLPGGLGVSLSSSVGSPGADPMRDVSQLYSYAMLDRGSTLGKALGTALANWQAGQSPFTNPDFKNQIVRALAPRSIYRAFQVSQDDSIRSLGTNNPIIKDVGLGDRLLYSVGFNPVGLDKTYKVYQEVKDSDDRKKSVTKVLGAALQEALDHGDQDEATRVYTRAMAIGVDTSSVMRSAQKRIEDESQSELERAVKPAKRGDWSFAFPQ